MARHRILILSEEQLREVQYERLHHEHPRVRQRMDVILLRAKGQTQLQVAAILDMSRFTIASYENLYDAGGIEALKELKWGGHVSSLRAHAAEIEAYLEKYPPRTLEEACDLIEKLTATLMPKPFVSCSGKLKNAVLKILLPL